MENKLISVIIPVYNTENYLSRCVDSVINQSYKNVEIILVDDGSVDDSPRLCDDYGNKDQRIKVVHKKNGGQSSARNAGLKASTGDYIGFIDSDDWVECDTYDYLLHLIGEKKRSIAEIGIKLSYDTDEKIVQPEEKICEFQGKESLQYFMKRATESTGEYSVCRCLFDKDVLTDVYFREGKINEDIDFKYKALSKSENFVVSNQFKYHYFQNGNSTSSGALKRRDFDLYDAADELIKLTEGETYEDIRFFAEVKRARTAFSLLSRIAYYGIKDDTIDQKELIKSLKKEHKKNIPMLLKAPLPFSRKVLAVAFGISFHMTKFFIRTLRFLTGRK